MTFLQNILAFIKGEITTLEAEAADFEKKFLPGAEAIAKKAVRIFGEKATPVLEQLGAALISGLATGMNPGVLIPQLVNDGIKDLSPEFIADGKNVLYGLANLALADATENTTPVVATTSEVAPAPEAATIVDTSSSEVSATAETAPQAVS